MEPLINKHLSVFTDARDHVFATSFGFQSFTYLDSTPDKHRLFIINVKYVSFTVFLQQIEFAVTRIMYNYITKEDPHHSILDILEDINKQIIRKTAMCESNCYIEASQLEPTTNAELYIFDMLSSVSCCINNHPVVPAVFVAELVKESGKVVLPVHYCNYCHKYFIGKRTLVLFEKRYGKLAVDKRILSAKNDSFQCFHAESKLHQFGYNVVDGVMTDKERQGLLKYLLDHDKISYLEICTTIEQNIRLFQNSYRHQLAVAKWSADLRYIGEHVMSKK